MRDENNGLSLPKTVGILYSQVKREYFPTQSQYLTEKDALSDARLIGKYLNNLGIQVIFYPGTPGIISRLLKDKPKMIFNFIGSVRGQEYLSSIFPGILESL